MTDTAEPVVYTSIAMVITNKINVHYVYIYITK